MDFPVPAKILFLTNVPSPYRVEFFNELGKYCDLTVVFEKRTSDERDSSWQNYSFDTFKGVFLNGVSVRTDAALCLGVTDIIKNGSFDGIICTNVSSPTGMLAVHYMKKKKIPYCLECDGAVAGSGRGLKENIKKYFIGGAQKYYSTSKSSDDYYITYGAEPRQLVRYPFTSLRASDIEDEPASAEEKKRFRKKLGIKEDKVIVSVGRFSYQGGYGKGFDSLIKAADSLKPAGIYIIGDEPTEEFLKMREDMSAENVYFIAHKNKSELREYYRAADVFVLMTRGDAWGLVINEAMSCGLPVITTDKCVAGLELVEHGVNGYIADAEDWQACARFADGMLEDDSLRADMGRRSLEKIREYTIEKMAQVHIAEWGDML